MKVILQNENEVNINLVAVLSTTVIPNDGLYQIQRIKFTDVTNVLHYIGHPSTKEIVENMGAIQSENKLFTGLEKNENAVCFAIKQGVSSRKELGHTVHQEINLEDLDIRLITRIN